MIRSPKSTVSRKHGGYVKQVVLDGELDIYPLGPWGFERWRQQPHMAQGSLEPLGRSKDIILVIHGNLADFMSYWRTMRSKAKSVSVPTVMISVTARPTSPPPEPQQWIVRSLVRLYQCCQRSASHFCQKIWIGNAPQYKSYKILRMFHVFPFQKKGVGGTIIKLVSFVSLVSCQLQMAYRSTVAHMLS